MHILHITKTTYALHITFVTPWGLKLNANSGISNSCIEISDLFAAKSLAITPKKSRYSQDNFTLSPSPPTSQANPPLAAARLAIRR